MKKTLKKIVRKGVGLARKSEGLAALMDEDAAGAEISPEAFLGRGWFVADAAMTRCRRALREDPTWRCGPQRVHTVAKEAYDALAGHGSVVGASWCDLGCGIFHPLGVSAVLYANGAEPLLATDLDPVHEPARAAEALYDLLADCLLQPDAWHWSDVPRAEFEARLRRFDVAALREGRLNEGIAELPFTYTVGDIAALEVEAGSIDRMASRAVLEHFLEFESAMARLFELTAPGGLHYHSVDIGDHRIYTEPEKYHRWSFLAEGEDWSDGLVNRLRFSEMRALIEQAGFEVLRYEGEASEMPEGFEASITGRFKEMSLDELNLCSLHCVLRKPA